jgi:hypothetical protein
MNQHYIKIAHEAPLSIFDKVQNLTHYDYFLVHLFEENKEYLNKALECVKQGRETILDNSIFELGKAWDPIKFALWVEKMKPTWYIVPDVLDQAEATMESFDKFMENHPDLPGKIIAVAQGQTYDDLVKCYKKFAEDDRVGKVAISFNHPFYQTEWEGKNKYERMGTGRQMTLYKMLNDGVSNRRKPHHLLGCGLPQEFAFYRHWVWVDSLDTSNPVMAGIKGMEYDRQPEYDIWGLDDKPAQKLYTIINDDVDEITFQKIKFNIEKFDYNINGWG